MMHRTLILLSLGLGLTGCASEAVRPDDPTEGLDATIGFNVREVSAMLPSRTLIESIANLQTSCTTDEAIALWGGVEDDSATFQPIFTGQELTYGSGWTYTGEPQYWLRNRRYIFRACYPARELGDKLAIQYGSSYRTIVLNFNAETMQSDWLLASAEVNRGQSGTTTSPVELTMKHALSALRFQFKYKGDEGITETGRLTACHLTNSGNTAIGSTGHLATTGSLTFGTDADPHSMSWTPSFYPLETSRMYPWEYSAGLEFSASQAATAYSAGSGNFTANDGYIMILPQATEGHLTLNATTEVAGVEANFSIPLPAANYEAGKRYTYTVQLSRTDLSLTLTVEDWNKLQSSTTVIF